MSLNLHRMDEEGKNIVVVVEDFDASKTALQWALHNLLRYGDVLTLLHVFSATATGSRRRKQLRRLRLHGYHLALSFKELCSDFFNTRIEIVVTEDDDARIPALVREIGAFALVAGLHDHSFLYRLAMTHNNLASVFNCRVLAVKQPSENSISNANRHASSASASSSPISVASWPASASVAFSQIEVSGLLQIPQVQPQKIPYRICPTPYAIIWRRSRKMRRREVL